MSAYTKIMANKTPEQKEKEKKEALLNAYQKEQCQKNRKRSKKRK